MLCLILNRKQTGDQCLLQQFCLSSVILQLCLTLVLVNNRTAERRRNACCNRWGLQLVTYILYSLLHALPILDLVHCSLVSVDTHASALQSGAPVATNIAVCSLALRTAVRKGLPMLLQDFIFTISHGVPLPSYQGQKQCLVAHPIPQQQGSNQHIWIGSDAGHA